ncbi:MAG: xanthine dehydrogenase family protein subunit M [Thermodesulfobacteriota bacterium]|jgi:carbon-monoxide dehydrogenase medium subunit
MEAEIRPLPRFEYFLPSSLDDVLMLLKEHGNEARLLAGGTDLIVKMKKCIISPGIIVDLNRVPELSFIELRGDNLHIGAATRLNDIKESEIVREKAPMFAKAIGFLACHVIRNRATIGGNLCSASPAADTAPPLLVLGASVSLQGPERVRAVALSEFFISPGQTILRSDELMSEVIVPCREGRSTFLKFGRRKGFTLSIASVAAFSMVTDGRFEEVKLAMGAVAPTPIRSRRIEEMLKGKQANKNIIEEAAQLAKKVVSPISDVRASASYRREMVYLLTKRVLGKVAMVEEPC